MFINAMGVRLNQVNHQAAQRQEMPVPVIQHQQQQQQQSRIPNNWNFPNASPIQSQQQQAGLVAASTSAGVQLMQAARPVVGQQPAIRNLNTDINLVGFFRRVVLFSFLVFLTSALVYKYFIM